MATDVLPGGEALVSLGFIALWDLPVTWSAVWRVWPSEHLQELPEVRDGHYSPVETRHSGPVCRFIRSPWREVTIDQVFAAARSRAVRYADWETNEQRGLEAMEQVLRLDSAEVLAEASESRE